MTLFCDENHIYRNEQGIIIPNVTSILQAEGFTDFSRVPVDVLKAAQDFGTNVHIACELADKGTLEYETLSPGLLPPIEAWCKFLEDYQAEIIEIERVVYSKIWHFCGTLDRVLKIKGKNGIYDIKTGEGCSLQTAAYKVALDEECPDLKVKERAAVRLFPDGTYRIIPHDDKSEESLFKSIVKVHNSRKNYVKGA
ncbi:MAG: hypothetical protein A2293_08015 [Elusimicrobia bacterium RIFOXYB2_FULL_49_7]|nr:MAG: hypothetical protein A2293_08015 [Elusimicrobia bacterium RIFOXYB2_FULL_49_7]